MRPSVVLILLAVFSGFVSPSLYGSDLAADESSFVSDFGSITLKTYGPPDSKARPVILLLHGTQGFESFRTLYESYIRELVDHGYRVHAVMYYDSADASIMTSGDRIARLNRYRKRLFSWAETVAAAVGYLEKRDDTEIGKIGVLGFSQGGFIAVAAAGIDERIKALAEVYGGIPSVLQSRITRLPATLILHGDADTSVPIAEAYALRDFLAQRSTRYEMKICRGAGHGFDSKLETTYASDARRRVLSFFDTEFAVQR